MLNTIILYINNTGTIAAGNLNKTNITITSVTNPLNVKQTSSFVVKLGTSTGSIIEDLKEGVTVTMSNTKNTFGSFQVTISEKKTMAVSDYTV